MALNSCRAWSTVARMLAKSTRGASATVLLAVILTVTAAGESQAPDPYQVYQSAVAAYVKSRDISRAVLPLQKWTGTEFDAAVKATMASGKLTRSKPRPFSSSRLAWRSSAYRQASRQATSGMALDLLDRWTAIAAGTETCRRGGSKKIPFDLVRRCRERIRSHQGDRSRSSTVEQSASAPCRGPRARKPCSARSRSSRRLSTIPTMRRPYQYENAPTESGWRCFTRPNRIPGGAALRRELRAGPHSTGPRSSSHGQVGRGSRDARARSENRQRAADAVSRRALYGRTPAGGEGRGGGAPIVRAGGHDRAQQPAGRRRARAHRSHGGAVRTAPMPWRADSPRRRRPASRGGRFTMAASMSEGCGGCASGRCNDTIDRRRRHDCPWHRRDRARTTDLSFGRRCGERRRSVMNGLSPVPG